MKSLSLAGGVKLDDGKTPLTLIGAKLPKTEAGVKTALAKYTSQVWYHEFGKNDAVLVFAETEPDWDKMR